MRIITESEVGQTRTNFKKGDVVIFPKIIGEDTKVFRWGIVDGPVGGDETMPIIYHKQYMTRVPLKDIIKRVPDITAAEIEEYQRNDGIVPVLKIDKDSKNGVCDGVFLWRGMAKRFKIREADITDDLYKPLRQVKLNVDKYLEMLSGVTNL